MTRLLRKQAAIRSAVRRGLLSAERPVCMFFDLDDFTEQIRSLKDAFPSNFEHCMAVKAQPTRRIMERAVAEGLDTLQLLPVIDVERDAALQREAQLGFSLDG